MSLILGKNREPAADFRNNTDIVQTDETRERATAIFGIPGSGKSSLMEAMIYQDACNGEAIFVIDPHWDLLKNVIAQLPAHRLPDTYLLDLTDTAYPFCCNFLDGSRMRDFNKATNWAENVFKKIFPAGGEQLLLSKVLRMVAATLLSSPGSTIADIPKLLLDDAARAAFVSRVANEHVRTYWEQYNKMSLSSRKIETYALNNRLPMLLTQPMFEDILAQPQSTVDFRRSIDTKEIILMHLPVDEYPEVAPIIGTVLIAELYRAAFSYTDTPRDKRPGFSVYIDEWHEFVAEDIGRMITSLRKFGCKLVVATQYRNKIKGENYDAVMAANTIIAMQSTADDARSFGSSFVDRTKKPKLVKLYKDDLLKRLIKHDNELVYTFAKTTLKDWLTIASDDDHRNQLPSLKLLEAFEKLLIASEQQGQVAYDGSLFDTAFQLSGWYFGHSAYSQVYQAYLQASAAWEDAWKKRMFLTGLMSQGSLEHQYLFTYYDHFYPGLSDPTAWVMQETVRKDAAFWKSVSDYTQALPWLHNTTERLTRLRKVHAFLFDQAKHNALLPAYTNTDDFVTALRTYVQQEYDVLRRELHLLAFQLYHYKALHLNATDRLRQAYHKLADEALTDSESSKYGPALGDVEYDEKRQFWGTVYYDVRPWVKRKNKRDEGKRCYEPRVWVGNNAKEENRHLMLFGLTEEDRPAYTSLLDAFVQTYERFDTLKPQLEYESDLLKAHNLTWNEAVHLVDTIKERRQYTRPDLLYQARMKELADLYARSIAEEEKAHEQALSRQQAHTEITKQFNTAWYTIAGIASVLAKEPIGEYEKPETASDVAYTLETLPPRYALVKMTQQDVSQTIYPLYTADRPPSARDKELDARLTDIRTRTRRTYCQPRQTSGAAQSAPSLPFSPSSDTNTLPYALFGEADD